MAAGSFPASPVRELRQRPVRGIRSRPPQPALDRLGKPFGDFAKRRGVVLREERTDLGVLEIRLEHCVEVVVPYRPAVAANANR